MLTQAHANDDAELSPLHDAVQHGPAANDDAHLRAHVDDDPTVRTLTWVLSCEDARWGATWESLWRGAATRPPPRARRALVAAAVRWLGERTHGARWARVWLLATDHAARHPEQGDLGALVTAAARWLPENAAHADWPRVLRTANHHADALPHDDAGRAWLALTAARVLRNAAVGSDPTLDLRDEGPPMHLGAGLRCDDATWARLWEAKLRGDAVLGRIVEAVDTGYVVDVGTRVFVPISRVYMEPGAEVEVRALILDDETRTTRQGSLKRPRRSPDETVVLGREEQGVVDGVTDYALFVHFRGFCGMLHRNDLAAGDEPSMHRLGERMRVRVTAVQGERIALALVGVAKRLTSRVPRAVPSAAA